jgi:hypothetical protein
MPEMPQENRVPAHGIPTNEIYASGAGSTFAGFISKPFSSGERVRFDLQRLIEGWDKKPALPAPETAAKIILKLSDCLIKPASCYRSGKRLIHECADVLLDNISELNSSFLARVPEALAKLKVRPAEFLHENSKEIRSEKFEFKPHQLARIAAGYGDLNVSDPELSRFIVNRTSAEILSGAMNLKESLQIFKGTAISGSDESLIKCTGWFNRLTNRDIKKMQPLDILDLYRSTRARGMESDLSEPIRERIQKECDALKNQQVTLDKLTEEIKNQFIDNGLSVITGAAIEGYFFKLVVFEKGKATVVQCISPALHYINGLKEEGFSGPDEIKNKVLSLTGRPVVQIVEPDFLRANNRHWYVNNQYEESKKSAVA